MIMKIEKIDIIHRFIPLACDLFIIVFLAFFIKIDNLNIVIDQKVNFLIYVDIALTAIFLITEIIIKKKVVSYVRSISFLLFLILSLSIPFILNNFDLFYSLLYLATCFDLVFIMYKMVIDSFFTEERMKNMKLPANQFTNKRKLITRIITISSLVLFFLICFIVFYFNEVSLEAILELVFVGIIVASIGQILGHSISLKPLNKFQKEFEKTLNFTKLKEDINSLYEDNLNDETINLMNIYILEAAILVDDKDIEIYKEKIHKPTFQANIKNYNKAIFYFLLKNKEYEMLLEKKTEFKKCIKPKKLFKAYIAAITNEEYKFKYKIKNKVDEIKYKIYDDIKRSKTNE